MSAFEEMMEEYSQREKVSLSFVGMYNTNNRKSIVHCKCVLSNVSQERLAQNTSKVEVSFTVPDCALMLLIQNFNFKDFDLSDRVL